MPQVVRSRPRRRVRCGAAQDPVRPVHQRFHICCSMRNQHRVYQTTARPDTRLPLKTLLTSHLHLVIAAAVESYTLATRTTLPFAVSLVVKACWLWEFHLRAEEATFGARILIQWCYHLAVAFALLPATGAAIKLAGGFTNTTPFADAIAKVTSLDGYVALASAVRGGDWAFRALRAQNKPADEVQARLDRAWAHADVELTDSHY